MKTYSLKINGKEYEVSIDRGEGNKVAVKVNGVDYEVELAGGASAGVSGGNPAAGNVPQAGVPDGVPVANNVPQAGVPDGVPAANNVPQAGVPGGTSTPYKVPTGTPAGGATEGVKVVSPLPGVIIEVSVREGQQVSAGQKIAVLEAMKMENEISAPKAGTVTAILVQKGDSLLEGATIATIA
ncbi:MAG: biotin/lipoyl-binding protein [Bacteroidales bacterium]|nr:biotin/lipoyl-binding protein [Bacteroidales bacterium]